MSCLKNKFNHSKSYNSFSYSSDMIVQDPSTGQEIVYTDSSYWMNPALLKKLRTFNSKNQPITVENSIYADFMICQGSSKSKDSVQRLNDPEKETSHELDFKRKICQLMENIPLKILLLPQSSFYHIGTLPEYLDAFCNDTQLGREFSFNRTVAVKRTTGSSNNASTKQEGVLINSVIPNDVTIPKMSVIGFSQVLLRFFLAPSSATVPLVQM